jgi:hypothetical protein
MDFNNVVNGDSFSGLRPIITVDISEAILHKVPNKTDFAFNRKSSVFSFD